MHRAFGWKFWSFVVGAAPLDPALEEFWQRLGFVVIQGYGLTETAPIVSLNHPFRTSRGSVGKAIAGVEMKIAADGEILVRGENVTSGYYGAAAATAEAFEDGWLHTGDIGELDGEGRLFIKGRKKEMIVTPEGLNVFPEDVERVVAQQPGVRDVAVVGLTQRARKSASTPSSCWTPAQIRKPSSARRTSRWPIIRRSAASRVWPSGELPRTEGTRKLKRRQIHDWVETGALPRRRSDGRDVARGRWSRSSPAGARSQPGTTLDELGLSSLERVELMVAIEDEFGTTVDEAAFASARADVAAPREELVAAGASDDRRARRHGRLPAVEPRLARSRAQAREPSDVDPAAGPRLCLDQRRGPRAPERPRRPGHVRVQPPEPYGHAGDSLARCRRSGATA